MIRPQVMPALCRIDRRLKQPARRDCEKEGNVQEGVASARATPCDVVAGPAGILVMSLRRGQMRCFGAGSRAANRGCGWHTDGAGMETEGERAPGADIREEETSAVSVYLCGNRLVASVGVPAVW